MPRILVTNGSRHLTDPQKVAAVIARLEKRGFSIELPRTSPVNPLTESSDPAGRIAELHREDIDVFWPARGGKAAIELFDHDLNIPFKAGQIYIGMSDHTLPMHYWAFNTDVTLLYGPVLGDLARTTETRSERSAIEALEGQKTFILGAASVYDDWICAKSGVETGGAGIITDRDFSGPYLAGLFSRMYTAQMLGIYGSLSGYLLLLEQINVQPEELYRVLREFCKMQPDVAGIVFGRFPLDCGITPQALRQIVESIPELEGKLVRYNYDFGHTYPITTIPLRGRALVKAGEPDITLTF